MKISKKTREQAALICAIAASTPACNGELVQNGSSTGVDPFSTVQDLAHRAWCQVYREHLKLNGDLFERTPWRELDAEAEALLRTGWSPGDKP